MKYDVIIVGGGTAGCVLANRLTEDAKVKVLLLEAGPDYHLAEMPDEITSAVFAPSTHNWGYSAQPDAHGNALTVLRGKVIGGSSAINYCFALRARPSDHDEWVALGNPGWGYEEVLPFYKRMESYAHGDDAWHGRFGPFKLTRSDWSELEPAAIAAALASDECGFARVEDANAPGKPGFSIVPLSASGGIRQSTAIGYLESARKRPNLEIRGNFEVATVVFEEGRAIGIKAIDGEILLAAQVILSAGTYNSPAILMRSGIGPREHLSKLGIDVVVDSPGVGQNLIEHPVMLNCYIAKDPARYVTAMFQTALSVCIGADEPDYDLHVLPSAAIPTQYMPPAFAPQMVDHPSGWDMLVFVSCMQPKSRGSVTLASADPCVPPLIDLGLYSHPDDLARVAKGLRIARNLASTAPLSELLVAERTPGAEKITEDDLFAAIRGAPAIYNHGVSTCKMGPETDPFAVVGNTCAVRGIRGLSVVDASVMPNITRVPTNPMTVLIAERVAGWVAEKLSRESA